MLLKGWLMGSPGPRPKALRTRAFGGAFAYPSNRGRAAGMPNGITNTCSGSRERRYCRCNLGVCFGGAGMVMPEDTRCQKGIPPGSGCHSEQEPVLIVEARSRGDILSDLPDCTRVESIPQGIGRRFPRSCGALQGSSSRSGPPSLTYAPSCGPHASRDWGSTDGLLYRSWEGRPFAANPGTEDRDAEDRTRVAEEWRD